MEEEPLTANPWVEAAGLLEDAAGSINGHAWYKCRCQLITTRSVNGTHAGLAPTG